MVGRVNPAPISFSPVASTNVGISPKNILTFSFFVAPVLNFKAVSNGFCGFLIFYGVGLLALRQALLFCQSGLGQASAESSQFC